MKIMIYDVPAESGGALTILNQYYDQACQDTDNDYIFVVSIVDLEETKNVKVIQFPWIKKSWFHRLYFDQVIGPKLVKKFKPQKVISLQNVIVPRVSVPQTLYVHQSLPFVDEKFSFFENKKYWIYQNVIGRSIKSSIGKADEVIVQTNWMKEEVNKIKGSNSTVKVISPTVSIANLKGYSIPQKENTFFYPASLETYKNHDLLIKAILELVEEGIVDFRVYFTVTQNEFEKTYPIEFKIMKEKNLPIIFMGVLEKEEVYKMYSQSVLLFPSSIETFGLPLLEARLSNTPIIALKTKFSIEILKNYKKVDYFNKGNYKEIAKFMKCFIKNK